jgi:hypothetical protein
MPPVDPNLRQLTEVMRIAAEATSRTVILLEQALPLLEQGANPLYPTPPDVVASIAPQTDELLRQMLVKLDAVLSVLMAETRTTLIRDPSGHAVASVTQVARS